MLNINSHDKLISYPSTKCLLQYLNAGKRLLLTHRCPSLYRVEKTIPLHIDLLILDENYFFINDTRFSLGLIRHRSAKRKLLTSFERDNADGGLYYDLDKYGEEDDTEHGNLSPGDIRILGISRDNQEDEILENWLMRLDAKKLKKLKKLKKPKKEDLEEIVQLEGELFPWKNRRGNTRDCYPRYIKFQVTGERGKHLKTEYLEYNKKLHESMKYLTTKFLGGRDIIGVKTLKVDLYDTVLRLPENLKLRIKQKIRIGGNVANVINPLNQILEGYTSLNIVEVNDYCSEFEDEENFDHPLIRTAKTLEIVNYQEPKEDWFSVVSQTKCKNVSARGGKVNTTDLWELVATILENQREIGTVYKIGLNEPNCFDTLRYEVWKYREELQIGGEIKTLASFEKKSSFKFNDLMIPMINKTSELHIYCKKNDEHYPHEFESPKFFLHFEIIPLYTCDKSEYYEKLSICFLLVLSIALICAGVIAFSASPQIVQLFFKGFLIPCLLFFSIFIFRFLMRFCKNATK